MKAEFAELAIVCIVAGLWLGFGLCAFFCVKGNNARSKRNHD